MTLLVRHVRCLLAGVLAIVLWLPAAVGVVPGGLSLAQAAQVQLPAGNANASTTTTTSSTCVADVDKVIATRPAPSSTASLPAELVDRLDAAAMAGLRVAATPGAIVGVRSPEGTWIKAYGEADPVEHRPMTADMHTRVGSITKTFTGTLLLQLQEQGRLSLDDTIDEYVSGVPNGNLVSLRQLANMTSGVASYTRNQAFVDALSTNPRMVFTPEQLLAYGLSQSPIFAPGAQFDYSNTNTVLLGLVIEKVTGRPIGDVFKEQILDPLRLNNTSWPGTSPELPVPYPQGYTLQSQDATPDHPGNATNWNPSWGWTAGAMIMDMRDVLTYGRALGTGQGLLAPATQAERLTSFPGSAGYGLAVGCVDGWVGHTGELPGYNTTLFYDTTRDTVVAVQTNSDIASGNCAESPTLTDDPRTSPCSSPATAIFVPVSEALGHPFTPNPQR
ncbi:MAG: beta-lactamase family protein [Chloroflexi bacterium]|nr:beta-lactamase family protein [Chloroflexota bacterium]